MKYFFSFFIMLISHSLWAQTLNEIYLGKLSKALKGSPFLMSEQIEFRKAENTGKAQEFILDKINEYTHSETFQFKMKTLMDEHLRLKADKDPLKIARPTSGYVYRQAKSAYDFLVENIITQNMSWDSLLLAKNYSYEYFKYPTFERSDREFFKNILHLKSQTDIVADIEDSIANSSTGNEHLLLKEHIGFDVADTRVAGILTTPRFLSRYQNTALNKNRRRAAAIFRSFLCDDMVAAIPPKTVDSEKSDFDVLIPEASAGSTENKTEEQLRRELRKSDPHGSLPGCMACHYKLDPMGRTLGLSAAGLSDQPAPGGLVYKSNGRTVNIAVNGVGDLAEKITQQKEYVDCQVNLFWKWFVGKDVPKTEIRHNQLVQQFENGQRRPLDFITYLVQTPEFKAPPVLLNEAQILSRKAAKVLKRCYDCHKNQNQNEYMKNWDLTDFPYGASQEEAAGRITLLSNALDIAGDGANKRMPPKDSLWQLSSDEFTILKTWIGEGAPDYNGKRQIQ